MSKITQYSRLSHHTLSGSASATFSVPPSEDFTDGTWNVNGTELALSEIGINEDSKKAYIRINDEIKEIQFTGATGGSGTSGTSGTDGTSGTSGTDGTSGTSGIDGTSGTSGIDGTSGTSGIDGTSGTSGIDGTSGTSGIDGTSGTSGIDGTSGTSGTDGTSGTSGIDGTSGTSGISPSQTLEQTLSLGNTTGVNEIVFGTASGLLFNNTSRLREGTIDAGYGGNKGIAQICAVGYEMKWESGSLYIMNGDGTQIREVRYTFGATPSVSDDVTKGFIIGSRWVLDNGDLYSCSDIGTASAVWNLEAVGVGNLEQTLSVGNTTDGNDIYISLDDRIYSYNGNSYIELNKIADEVVKLFSTDGTQSSNILVNSVSVNIQHNDGVGAGNYSEIAMDSSSLSFTKLNTAGNQSTMLMSNDNIISTATDVANTITDTISVDPQGLGNGTGIKSENTTTGIYSQTTHTPDTISLASVDGAGETSQISIMNGGGQGVEIQTGDANNYSIINITSGYTTLSLTDIPNNQVDALVLDTANTGLSSENTTTGVSSGFYVSPDTFTIASDDNGTFSTNINSAVGGAASIDIITINQTGPVSQINIADMSGIELNVTDTNTSAFLNKIVLGGNITSPYGIEMTSSDLSVTTGFIGLDATTIIQEVTNGTYSSNLQLTPQLGRLSTTDTITNWTSRVDTTDTYVKLLSTDNVENMSIMLDTTSQQIQITTPDYNTSGFQGRIMLGGAGSSMNVISFEQVTTTTGATSSAHIFTPVSSGPKSYKVRVVGYKDDYTKSYLSELFGLYNYDGANITLIGTLDKVEKTNFSTATSTIEIQSGDIIVKVVGEAATTINWDIYVEMNTTN